jgi:hypothetical protein
MATTGRAPSFKGSELPEGVHKVLTVVCALILLAIGYAGCTALYDAIDRTGWMSHNRDVVVHINGNWMVGEYRRCFADLDSLTPKGALTELYCTRGFEGGSTHALPVLFWGRVERPDKIPGGGKGFITWLWRCRRKAESLTCWAVN